MSEPAAQSSPYEILGLQPEATAAQIRDRYNDLAREAQSAGLDATRRAKRLHELEAAYNALRTAVERARTDFFLLDAQIGRKGCEAVARTLLNPETKVEGLIQPKSVKVSHTAILAEPKKYVAEPPPLVEIAAPPLEGEQRPQPLPAPLAPEFDC